jgi:hypothetical protein
MLEAFAADLVLDRKASNASDPRHAGVAAPLGATFPAPSLTAERAADSCSITVASPRAAIAALVSGDLLVACIRAMPTPPITAWRVRPSTTIAVVRSGNRETAAPGWGRHFSREITAAVVQARFAVGSADCHKKGRSSRSG